MKGLSLQVEENSSGERFESRVMAFEGGMLQLYGCKGVCVQRNGLYRTSEKTSSQRTLETWSVFRSKKVDRHVPRHWNDPFLN